MDENSNRKILARTVREDFIGRARELDVLWQHAKGESGNRGLLLLSAPSAGVSEILGQVYDRLFSEQKTIPFYFAFNRTDRSAKDCTVRFLRAFLLQTVAFRRADPELLNISPDVCEINELAAPSDAHWIHQLTKVCGKESELNDEQSFVRQALSAPLRAAANNAPVVILLDDLQNAPPEIIEELKKIYLHSSIPFIFAGRRRFVLNAMLSGEQKLNDVKILKLGALQNTDAELLTENLAIKLDVKINESTRDLIVRQLNAKPGFIEFILTTARDRKNDLETFQAFEQIYIDELFGGQIGKFYDSVFSNLSIDLETGKILNGLLYASFKNETGKASAKIWRETLALSELDCSRLINRLHVEEIINSNSAAIGFSPDDNILKDYIESNYRLESLDEPRALVIGETLKNSLKRAPQLMASSYRRSSTIGLRELLSIFNCQSIPLSLIDYETFKLHHKEIVETTSINLPQTVYTASSAAFYPPIAQVTDENRTAVALGFETADYRQENEIVWIAAEIESKLEAAKELTEFWCDRLEAVALICDFPKYRLWLVAPEGFSPEAVEVLKQRNAYGSSRRQVELLTGHLKAEGVLPNKHRSNEYEMILPMGEDTEMIAAGAVEEVAKKHHFAPKEITKIKTALVEAYINATEHSLSPDRKIYQKLTIDDDKLTITISNRGIKLPAHKFAESRASIEPENGRRGWGLKLMRTLMDEVNFEQVDDGTRISMVKYKQKSEAAGR